MRRWGILLVVGIFLSANVGHAQTAVSASAVMFDTNCSVCHGDDGAGSAVGKSLNVPDLRSSKVRGESNAVLARFIREGRGGMPAFGYRLNQQQILDEVRYIKTLPKHADTKN